MNQLSSFHFQLSFLISLLKLRNNGVVDAANSFDWGPSVSLTENFGVPEGLCLDIQGYGESLDCSAVMQLHTCKPEAADTQFLFDFGTSEIRSVNYDSGCQSITDNGFDMLGACVTVNGNIAVGDNLRLAECNGAITQSFEVRADGTIRTVANGDLCLAKTSSVGPAGPMERTDFALVDCQTADVLDVTWTLGTSSEEFIEVLDSTGTDAPFDINNIDPNDLLDLLDDDEVKKNGSLFGVTIISDDSVIESTISSASMKFGKSASFAAISCMGIFVAFFI